MILKRSDSIDDCDEALGFVKLHLFLKIDEILLLKLIYSILYILSRCTVRI